MDELLKRGLVFCIKPLDLMEVFVTVGFIKARISTLWDSLKHLRWIYFAEIVFGCNLLTFF